MSDISTNTLFYTNSTSRQLNPGNYVVRIYDLLVCGSGTNPCVFMLNEGNAVDTAQKIYIKTDNTGTGYVAVSSTNAYSFGEGIAFTGGCYIQTGPGFGCASITYGLEMA